MDFAVDLSSAAFWMSVMQIILIDILLGGDNAVVIALACRKLSPEQRQQGIFWGVTGAIGLRIILIFFALQLMQLPFLKIVGALLLIWIGIKLLIPEDEGEHEVRASTTLWGAVKTVVIADAVMSLDNVIAVAAAAKGHMGLVILGILISIPIIVWGSQLVLKIMDRFAWVITLGGALLGYIAGSMFIGDQILKDYHSSYPVWLHYVAGAIGAAIVVILGMVFTLRMQANTNSTKGDTAT